MKTRKDFNPRSPWGERHLSGYPVMDYAVFQSTLPVGGATGGILPFLFPDGISIHAPRGGSDHGRNQGGLGSNYFNPRSPWGERPTPRCFRRFGQKISIHAPRGGSDPYFRKTGLVCFRFQSTLPVGGATRHGLWRKTAILISIHAPRGGSDGLGDHSITP